MPAAFRSPITTALVGFLLAVGLASPTFLSGQDAIVRTVIFYSPSCAHCHQVMTRDLPPLSERYGDRLMIVSVNVASPMGQMLFDATAEHFGIPPEERGVPMMVAGEEVMVGSLEIPERLPGIIERGLRTGGVVWPAVAPLRDALAAQGLAAEERAEALDEEPVSEPREAAADPTEPPRTEAGNSTGAPAAAADSAAGPEGAVEAPEERPAAADSAAAAPPPAGPIRPLTPSDEEERTGVADLLRRDPVGNGIAVAVLLALIGVLAVSARHVRTSGRAPIAVPIWLVPVLSVLGMGVAAYLSFVEVTGQEAVCGPVGDCNAVQQSPYAFLFGVLPVGLLGLAGYVAMLGAWSLGKVGAPSLRMPARRTFWAMAFVGTVFSVYLTFLEPFVIGATCAWCVGSAVIVGLLLLAATADLRPAPA